MEKLQTAIKGNRFEILILLALGTGLREGELLGLFWSDIDFAKAELHIHRTLKYCSEISQDGARKGVNKLHPPKTRTSMRTVPIPSPLLKRLRRHQISEMEKCLAIGLPFSYDYFVFTNHAHEPYLRTLLVYEFRCILTRAGIPIKKFHTLRHTYATQAIKAGVSLLTVSRLLGHSSVKTTEIYAHVLDEAKAEAAELLSALFQ